MQKILTFGTNHEEIVKDETLKGILLKFKPMKDDGAGNDVVCDINDLNQVALDLVVTRSSGKEIKMFEGYLEDLLVAMYSQNVKFALCKKKTNEGYLIFIDFTPSVLQLVGKDELRIRFSAKNTTFTGTVLSKSTIELITMPGFGHSPVLPQIKAYPIGKDEITIDKNLGDDIVKVTVATDFTADYLSSVKSKLVSGDLRAQGFDKPFTEPQLLAENMHYFDNNPESDVEDLVVYMDRKPLRKVKLRGKLDKPADVAAKILTLGLVSSH